MKKTRTFALTTLAALTASLMAACSSVPMANAPLDQARRHYDSAQGDAQVAKLAPDELKRASDSLRVAEQAWRAGGKPVDIDHLAYVADQRVSIAKDAASARAALADVAGAAAERDKLRLSMRTAEADKAQRELAASQQSNAQKSSELAAADVRLTARTNEIDAANKDLAASQQMNAQRSLELAAADAAAQRDKAQLEIRAARVGDLEAQLTALNAKKTDRGMVVTLGDVLFDSGKSRLTSDSSGNLGKLAEFFKRNPDRKASIEGYTDSVGSAESNLELSGRRAGAVMTALVNLGVSPGQLRTQAHGKEMPASSNETAAGRQMNRRVEIVFENAGDAMVTK